MFEFWNQPLRTLYWIYFLVSIPFVRLPFWALIAIPPFLRPRRSWTFTRSVIMPGLRAYVSTWWATSLPLPPGIGADAEEIAGNPEEATALGFTWVPPLPEELITIEIKEFMTKQSVKNERTLGYWFQRNGIEGLKSRKAGPNEKVILHFHGGGYVVGSPHPQGGAIGPVTDGLLANVSGITRVFAGGYRLTASHPFSPVNPFPAALLDALACYYYLLTSQNFSPENIIIGGDSAGGHLALSIARYIARQESSIPKPLPVPGALLLLSPTSEWAVTHLGKSASMTVNQRTDYCAKFFKGYIERGLVGSFPISFAFTSAWISPASLQLSEEELDGLFVGFPKNIYFLTGDGEICLDSYRTLKERMLKDVGEGVVTYNEVPDSTHDFITMTWHEPERTESLKDISRWVATL